MRTALGLVRLGCLLLLGAAGGPVAGQPESSTPAVAARTAAQPPASPPSASSHAPVKPSEAAPFPSQAASTAVPIWTPALQLSALTAGVLAASLLVAFRLAILNRFNAQVDAFVKLRTAFTAVRAELPPDFSTLTALPADPNERRALERYWHQSFDEWFVTQRLHRLTLGKLWRRYYQEAILRNRESPVMLAALLRAKDATDNPIDDEFVHIVLHTRRRARKKRGLLSRLWWRIPPDSGLRYESAERLKVEWAGLAGTPPATNPQPPEATPPASPDTPAIPR
jgi:hypothetical protein